MVNESYYIVSRWQVLLSYVLLNYTCTLRLQYFRDENLHLFFFDYRIYSCISCKIYDKIMPQKLGGNLYAGHKIKTFFPGAKIRNFQCTDNQ